MLPRIVSLVPSSTETLLALGADVVACTRFCEQPDLTHVGGTKNPDLAAIIALEPDLVVVDREENRVEDHDALVEAGVPVLVTRVVDLASALEVISQLGEAAGVTPPNPQPLDSAPTAPARSAFVPIWRRPWMTISPATYGASVLRAIGIELVDVGSDDGYPSVELEMVQRERPELVVVPSEPYEFRTEHLDELAEAFPAAQVVEVDGQDLFWWGVRTPRAITRLAGALAPRPMR